MKLPAFKLSSLKIPTGGITLSPRVRRIMALSGYPLFYLFCLFVFAYFTFPYERLRERLLVELDAQRQGNPTAQRVEIQSLGPYWFSGVSLKGLSLISPRPASEPGPATSKLTFDQAHVRVSILPLLIGRVTINFGAKAFDGSIDGWTRANADERRIEASLDDIDMSKMSMVGDMLGGLPMAGTMKGKLEFVLPEQKLAKANGTMSLAISDFAVADGTTKVAGKLALPQMKMGAFELAAEAKDGLLKVTKLGAQGKDLDFAGEGKIALRDPFAYSSADLNVRFRFADGYKTKNEMTKSLFGAPGSNMPALFELADPRIRTSKRPDGFYGWHMVGQVNNPRFEPSAGRRRGGRIDAANPPGLPPNADGGTAAAAASAELGQESIASPSFARSVKYRSLVAKRMSSRRRSFTGTALASSPDALMSSPATWRSCAIKKPTRSAVRSTAATHFLRSSDPPPDRSFETRLASCSRVGPTIARCERGQALPHRALELRLDRKLRRDQLDRREEPRLEPGAGRHQVPHVEPGPVVSEVPRRDEGRGLRRRSAPRAPIAPSTIAGSWRVQEREAARIVRVLERRGRLHPEHARRVEERLRDRVRVLLQVDRVARVVAELLERLAARLR